MIIFVIAAIISIQTVISTGVLAGALLITGEEAITKETLLKCLGITIMALLVALLPIVGCLSGIVWFAALMSVFEKDFLEAVVIAITCFVISFLLNFLLRMAFTAVGLLEATA